MNAAHTPGPWHYKPLEEEPGSITFDAGSIRVGPSIADVVATVVKRGASADSRAETAANAAVIAAAPELLEAAVAGLAYQRALEQHSVVGGRNLVRDLDALQVRWFALTIAAVLRAGVQP